MSVCVYVCVCAFSWQNISFNKKYLTLHSVGYVVHEDADIVLMSSRALQFLSSHPANRKLMKEFPELVAHLTLTYSQSGTHPKAKEFSLGALRNLGVSVKSPQKARRGGNDENAGVNAGNDFWETPVKYTKPAA